MKGKPWTKEEDQKLLETYKKFEQRPEEAGERKTATIKRRQTLKALFPTRSIGAAESRYKTLAKEKEKYFNCALPRKETKFREGDTDGGTGTDTMIE